MADKNYFRLTSLEDGNEVGIANSVDDISQITLEYSTDDGSTWNNYTVGDIVRLDTNRFVLFRGDNLLFSKNTTDYHHVFASKTFNASGNIMSLLDKSCELVDFSGKLFVFYKLFNNLTTLIDASELLLPATTLSNFCYYGMFDSCTSLTSAPALPATTLIEGCYNAMFKSCTSLTTTPVLPATTLADSCYFNMFNGCKSITTAPALPAKTLVGGCYGSMFFGCSKLNRIEVSFTDWNSTSTTLLWVGLVSSTGTFICPEGLPETRGFSNIPSGWTIEHPSTAIHIKKFYIDGKSVKTLFINSKEVFVEEFDPPTPPPTDFWGLTFTAEEAGSTVKLAKSGSSPTVNLQTSTNGTDWITYTVGDTITLANVGDKVFFTTPSGSSNSKIGGRSSGNRFEMTGKVAASGNINSLLNGDEHTASTMSIPSSQCYDKLFLSCDSLTMPPELPSTTLQQECYESMFQGCTSLRESPELPATTISTGAYGAMFNGCTNLVKANKIYGNTVRDYGCSVMFLNCTSLSSVDDLDFTSINSIYSIRGMFDGCTVLSSINVKFTSWPTAGYATDNWLNNVAESGTFYCLTALGTDTTIQRGVSKCPVGWTVINTDI